MAELKKNYKTTKKLTKLRESVTSAGPDDPPSADAIFGGFLIGSNGIIDSAGRPFLIFKCRESSAGNSIGKGWTLQMIRLTWVILLVITFPLTRLVSIQIISV